jgi:hypothetical protein
MPLAKILTFGIPVVTWLFRYVRGQQPRARSTLRSDLDLFEKFADRSDPSRAILKASIDRRVAALYGPGRSDGVLEQLWARRGPVLRAVPGVVIAIGAVALTVYLVREDGFTWWAIPLGYLAFLGIGLISMALAPRHDLANKYAALGRYVAERAHLDLGSDEVAQKLLEEIRELERQPGAGAPDARPQAAPG